MQQEHQGVAQAVDSVPLFSSLDEAQKRLVAQWAVIKTIGGGEQLFGGKGVSKGLHVLLSGRIKLFKASEDGKEQTIYLFGPGEVFCLCSVFSDEHLPANMTALETSQVLTLAPKHFEQLAMEDPMLLLRLLRVMSRRLKEAMELIDALSLKQIPSRLAAYFLSHARSGRVCLGITHKEFAKIIGVTPEALSRNLGKMARKGVIELEGNEIAILDEMQLQECRDGVWERGGAD
ncbi:MAG: Crp/Fnr family transcriptional regulator [Desulfovibrio sp.]|nr:MAG: Crp/Fnr family transcriptional regulator [Desulfovibrio sp.]